MSEQTDETRLVDAAQYPVVTVFGVFNRPPITPPDVNGLAAQETRRGDSCAFCAASGMCMRAVMAGGPLLCEAATEAEVETGTLLHEVGS